MAGEIEEEEEKNEEKEYANITPEFHEKVKETFTIFEKEQSGSIETKSLGTLLRTLDFNPTEEEMVEYEQKYDPRGEGSIKYNDILKIVDQKLVDPDTIDEFIEAAKVFDHD